MVFRQTIMLSWKFLRTITLVRAPMFLVELCAEQSFAHLKDLCDKPPYLAIIADETTDKATQTQLSVCIRYLETVGTDINANEILLGFYML